MTSPARKHREQYAAKAAAQEVDLTALTPYQKLLKQLYGDKAILKSIASHQDKEQAKADMLPSYADWLKGIIESGQIAAGDHLTPTLLIWQIDCGLLDEAMPLAQIAMTSPATSPDEFQRTLPEIVVEQYAEKIGQGAAIDAAGLDAVVAWATDKTDTGQHRHNLPDIIRAKALKAVGEHLLDGDDPDKARILALFEQALGYHSKIGLKRSIAALQQDIAAEKASQAEANQGQAK